MSVGDMNDNIIKQPITVVVYKDGKPIGEVQGEINVKTSKITLPKGTLKSIIGIKPLK